MQWWCVAQQGAWSWSWRPLIGVWLVVSLLAVGYWRLIQGAHSPASPAASSADGPADGPAPHPRWRSLCYGLALFLLWASLDWPLGPLGASYLASVHMIQFLAVGIAAPALILLAIPPEAFERLHRHPRVGAVLGSLTRPFNAFLIFNVVMTVTHWPSVVDGLMPTQLGSFVLDLAWLAGGLILWWPMIVAVPGRTPLHPLGKIGYLALNAFLIRPPFAMMIFSENPIYTIYELAPPPARDAMNDQQLAGAIMKIGLAWMMFVGVFVIFRQWVRLEDEAQPTGIPSSVPDGPLD